MKRQKFVYTAHAGDNTKFVDNPKREQKAKFVDKVLSDIPTQNALLIPTLRIRRLYE